MHNTIAEFEWFEFDAKNLKMINIILPSTI